MAAKPKIKVGDTVEWETSQGKTKGVVKKKLTAPTKIKGHKVAASKKNPELLVESTKTGKRAAHKPEALKKAPKSKAAPATRSSGKKSTVAKPAAKSKTASRSTKPDASSSTTKRAAPSKAASSGKNGTAAATGRKKQVSASSPASRSKKSSAAKSSNSAGERKSTKGKSPAKQVSKSQTAKSSAPKASTPRESTAAHKTAAPKKAKITVRDGGVIKEFKKMVNLTKSQLERWLSTKDSKKVGFKEDGKGESVGHESGRKILRIMDKRAESYTADDVEHIRKVVAYIKRHLAQKPKGDIVASNWRYSLMNWGHDPAK